jgi:lysophospholipase L1-like esterase
LEAFQERASKNEALYYTDDMHLNPAGNAALAAVIEQWWSEWQKQSSS